MIKVSIILLLSIFVDGIISSYFTVLTPFVFISCSCYLFKKIKEEKSLYIFILYFLLFDLLNSQVFLFYTFLYFTILICINYIYEMFGEAYPKVIMFTITIFLVNYLGINMIFSDRIIPLQYFLNLFACCFVTNNICYLISLKSSKR